jgi:hypothetical protein
MFEEAGLTFTAGALLVLIARVVSWRIAASGAAKAWIRVRRY